MSQTSKQAERIAGIILTRIILFLNIKHLLLTPHAALKKHMFENFLPSLEIEIEIEFLYNQPS